jgi:hypothetical protein
MASRHERHSSDDLLTAPGARLLPVTPSRRFVRPLSRQANTDAPLVNLNPAGQAHRDSLWTTVLGVL